MRLTGEPPWGSKGGLELAMKASLKRSPSPRTLVRWTAGPILGLVFIAAAYSKAVDPRETIRAFEWLAPESPGFADAGLRALIFGELALGALLLTGLGGRATFSAALGVLAVFTGWIVHLAAVGLLIACEWRVAIERNAERVRCVQPRAS